MSAARRMLTLTACAATLAPAVTAADASLASPGTRPAAARARRLARHARPDASVRVGTATVGKLGAVLVRGSGRVLYMFQPLSSATACSAACERIWPPFFAPVGGVAKAVDGARQSFIGSRRDPASGRRIVTYAGHPLYTYVLDTRAREATGQNVALNGGFWWVLSPAGRIIRTPVSHGGGYVGS